MIKKGFLQNFLLLIIATVFTLLLSELIVRAAVPFPADIPPDTTMVYESSPNKKLRFKLRPGASKYQFGTLNQINHSGFRDREFGETKLPGTTRILFLGDSVTYGHGIHFEYSVP